MPRLVQLVILAQKMLYIQTKVLEDAATVQLGPQLYWNPEGSTHGYKSVFSIDENMVFAKDQTRANVTKANFLAQEETAWW